MQNLWSRVAQTRSCRCVSCIHHSAKALSRRTATSATRPQVTAGDLFTACFSSTLATAAVLDMKVKQKRRNQWDRAIREAKGEDPAIEEWPKEELADEALSKEELSKEELSKEELSTAQSSMEQSLMEEPAIQEPAPEDGNLEREFSRESSFRLQRVEVCPKNVTVRVKKALKQTNMQWLAKWDGRKWRKPPPGHTRSMDEQLGFLNRYVNNVLTRTQKSAPGRPFGVKKTVESATTGETFTYYSKLPDRKPKKPIHLQRNQESISRLVSRLLSTTKSMKLVHSRNAEINKMNTDSRAEIAAKISQLASADVELPSYGPVDTERAESQVRELNRSLTSILQVTDIMPDIRVAKVCYNLMVSPVPPDITTYNVLMLNFTKLGLGDLCQVVVDGFLDDCKLKPNEITISAILNHYISQNDYDRFYRLIQRMRGVAGDMHIKKRHIYHLYHKAVVSWASKARVIHRGGYMVEKVPRDQMIFHKLVVGTCMFNHMERAVMFTRGMIREGYCLTLGLLNTLVRACISKSDLNHARQLLRIVLNTWASDEARNDGIRRLDISSHARYFIHMLMSFCGVNLSGSWKIEGIASPLLVSRFDVGALHRFARALQLESLSEDVDRMCLTISEVVNRLAPYIPALQENKNYTTTRGLGRYKVITTRELRDPSSTFRKCIMRTETYLSRRLEKEDVRQKQKRLREKEAAILYLEGGKVDARIEKARMRQTQKPLVGEYHCEDDHSLATPLETEARQSATTEGTIEKVDADAPDEKLAESVESPMEADSHLESENPTPILIPMVPKESRQLALLTTSESNLRIAATAA